MSQTYVVDNLIHTHKEFSNRNENATNKIYKHDNKRLWYALRRVNTVTRIVSTPHTYTLPRTRYANRTVHTIGHDWDDTVVLITTGGVSFTHARRRVTVFITHLNGSLVCMYCRTRTSRERHCNATGVVAQRIEMYCQYATKLRLLAYRTRSALRGERLEEEMVYKCGKYLYETIL